MDTNLILFFLILYGVAQLFLTAATIIWVFRFRRDLGILHAKMWDINNEIVMHAVALNEAGLIPLPWEAIEEELEDFTLNDYDHSGPRQEGNVYYLDESD